jgi:hypothetical protein
MPVLAILLLVREPALSAVGDWVRVGASQHGVGSCVCPR